VTVPTKPTTKGKGPAEKGGVVITRSFDAPRERVWKAWTDPEQLRRWWGPNGFTTPVCTIDLRVGGVFLYCMRSPEGKDYWATGVYREIVPVTRLVYTDSFADAKGRVVPATYYGMSSEIPLEMLVTVTFEKQDGRTKMTLRHDGLPAGADREGAQVGWSEMFDKLAESLNESPKGKATGTDTKKAYSLTLPTDREIVMERTFDAPRARVFEVYTDPKLIPLWWGPRRYTTTVDKMDVRAGGVWRYISRGADGTEYAFNGVYREIRRPERLVSTFEFEGMPGHIVVDTATFEERGGKTKVTVTSRFESVEDRDGMLKTGMEEGAAETWDRLAELLRKA
jgi:uncharacterized protein YndB with AHSA1/START domain